MKRFLLATAAITLVGAAAYAMDDDEDRETRVRVGHSRDVMALQDGTVIEIRGPGGERTIHMQSAGADGHLTINGQNVDIQDGQVTIDGQTIAGGDHAIIIIDGDEIRVVDNENMHRFDGQFEIRMAERAEDMARMASEMSQFRFDFDSEGLEADVMSSLEAALAGLDDDVLYEGNSRDWDDLSEEERANVRESLAQAREDVRHAMEDMRAEMADARHAANDQRRVHVEISREARERAHAEREAAHMTREEARRMRDEARQMRDHARHEARVTRWTMERSDDAANDHEIASRNIRVERSDDGRQQVWVNGEEQTGNDLVTWLNQLEAERLSDRLAGGPGDERHERRIIRYTDGDGNTQDLDVSDRNVIVMRDIDSFDDEFEVEVIIGKDESEH
tara:strand:+ start:5658 stop:6836 length:1179 start_codon:yes stop_codon:yes gene_type:complete